MGPLLEALGMRVGSTDFTERHPACHGYGYDPWTLKKLACSEGFIVQDLCDLESYASDRRGVRGHQICLLARKLQ